METPCIDICKINQEIGYCIGCGRSNDEIGRWSTMTDGERRAIMIELESRRVLALEEK